MEQYLYVLPDSMLQRLRSETCSHGFVHANNSHRRYPYNASAAYIVSGIVQYINRGLQGQLTPAEQSSFVVNLFRNPEHAHLIPTIDDALLKACIMFGTDLMRTCSGRYENCNYEIAKALAQVVLHLEEFFHCFEKERSRHQQAAAISSGPRAASLEDVEDDIKSFKVRSTEASRRKMVQQLVALDCVRNVVRFYDARNPCSCLDQAKKQHNERMGKCCNPGCTAPFCLDAKLLTCSRCQVYKYCGRDCQKAHWSEHKVRHAPCMLSAHSLA